MRLNAMWALAALALTACNEPSSNAPAGGGESAAAAAAGGPPADAPNWVRAQWSDLPDWNYVANISDGGKASFSPRSIRRDPATLVANVDVQILYAQPVPYRAETATTIETTWYFKERASYRLKCAERTFAVIQREYLGEQDAVLGADQKEPQSEADWRSIDSSGLARVLEGPVCKAV